MKISNGVEWQIFGHQSAKNILSKQLNSKHFPHAYLFTGPEGLGKKSLSLEFAKKVLNTEKLENHPDFNILDVEGEIVVEQVLDFIGKLGFKPFLGEKKIAIINNAQNLNLQSSNALLKTLEEPGPSSIIILIAGSARLLPTIVSRCQILNFNVFSQAGLKDFAQHSNMEPTQEMLDLSFGRSGRMKELGSNKDFFEQEKVIVEEYQKLTKSALGEKLSTLGNFADLEPQELERNLLTWLFWQVERLQQQPKEFLKVQALTEAWQGLGKNQNKKLVLQGLFMKI